jgi:hypothetical protein
MSSSFRVLSDPLCTVIKTFNDVSFFFKASSNKLQVNTHIKHCAKSPKVTCANPKANSYIFSVTESSKNYSTNRGLWFVREARGRSRYHASPTRFHITSAQAWIPGSSTSQQFYVWICPSVANWKLSDLQSINGKVELFAQRINHVHVKDREGWTLGSHRGAMKSSIF